LQKCEEIKRGEPTGFSPGHGNTCTGTVDINIKGRPSKWLKQCYVIIPLLPRQLC